MRGVNKLIVVGRLGRAPEVHNNNEGTVWCSFPVATNRRRKEGDDWVEVTDWHQVRVFGTPAESCGRMLRAGSLVGVEGAMTYDTWHDERGGKHFSAKVLADRVNFIADLKPLDAVPEPSEGVGE